MYHLAIFRYGPPGRFARAFPRTAARLACLPPGLIRCCRLVFVTFLLVGLVPGLASCSRRPTSSQVLARVGPREITVKDFNSEVQWHVQNQRPLPDKEALLEQMIVRELRVQKARAAGLEKDPDVRRGYETLLASKLEERNLMPRIDALKVSPEQIHAAFEQDLARYRSPAKARLAIICIRTSRKMDEARRAQLLARIAEARRLALDLPSGTRGFGAVAGDFSEDEASRYRGGDVGWFDEGQPRYRWPGEVVAAGFALKDPREISDVIQAEDGLYLVTRLESRPASTIPLEKVRPALERRLLGEMRNRTEHAFQQELRASVSIETNTQALAGVAYPTPTMANANELTPPGLPRSR